MKNLVFNLRTKEAQTGCATSSRMAKLLTTLLFLTLGVGQMWALDIYLDTHNFTDWTSSSATFKLWPGTGSDVSGTKVTTNLYKFSVSSATGTMYFKRYDSGGSSQWNEFSVTYNSSYNTYKVTGWNAGSCANYNVSIATKTHYIYFDNSTTGWSNSYKYFVIGHDNPTAYSKVYSMSALGHTKLWYVSQSSDSWTDLTYYAICSPTSSWSGTSWGSSNISNANKYAAPYKDKYDMNNSSSYLFTPASSSNNCALTIDYKTGYSALNYSQTVKKYTCTAEYDGSLASQYKNADINSGTVTISAYKLTGNGTVSNTSNSATLDEASEKSASKDAVYTGEVTLTASPNTGYTFVGWFSSTSASTALSTETTYTYNAPKSTKTVYARFKEDRYTVKVQTYTNGSATPTSNQYGGIATGVALTATPNTGYQFNGWTINSGTGSFGDASTASTSFYPTSNSQLKATFTAKNYTVTLDKNGGDSNGSIQTTYNSNTTSNPTYASRAGYSCDGYFTDPSTGSKVINTDGTLVSGTVSGWLSSGYWVKDAASITLYAHWTEDVTYYNLKFGTRSGESTYGTVAAINATTSASLTTNTNYLSGTSVRVTATPDDDYKFVSWYNAATGGSEVTTDNPYTFTLNAATSVYAHFVQKSTTITLNANGGSGGTTSKTINHGASMTGLTAPGRSGYTFTGWWTATSEGVKVIDSDGTLVASVSGYTTSGKKWDYDDPTLTLYAQWTEKKSTITVTTATSSQGTLKFGSTSKSWGATASLGVATTQEITATAAAGFTFVRWDLSGAAASASTLTNATITLKADGSGSTGTATAVFEEDLSSPWVLKGGTNITGDNWATEHAMTKKTGHSTENVAYYTANISSTNSGISGSADAWSFKLIKNSAWYGLTADGSYWWGRSTSANQSLNTSGANIQICADVAGTYEIKVDYSTATPKITITFPTKYTVTYSVSPSGAANAITTSPSVSSGGSVAAGTSVTFTHADAKTGYSWYRWENGSGSSLGTGSTYTTTINANTTVVAKYTENSYNVTATASAGGSATPASATSMGQVTGGDITASPNTGYNFTNWTITSGSGYFGASGTSTTSTTANTKFRPTAAATIQANFTPKQTTITLDNQDATTPGSTSVTATYDAEMPAITLPTKTGYTFGGYWGAPGGSGPQYYNADGSSAQNWNNVNPTYTLYAKWTAKTYTVTLDYDETNHGDITSTPPTNSVTTTYGAEMPAIAILPKATEGYGFMGYYSAAGGSGTQYYDGTGTSVTNWDVDDNVTLYAYYKKAEITVGLAAAVVAPWTEESPSTVTATPTLSPSPEGNTKICWFLLQNNNNPVEPQPSFTPGEGNSVSFPAPTVSGNYKVVATLRTGTSCDGGTLLDADTVIFTVAGEHTVTILYKCGDDVIKASTTSPGKPLEGTSITAPDIIGYKFHHWVLGDGVTLASGTAGSAGSAGTATISYTAIYDGHITAVYTKKRLIYFNNTLNWSGVTVYFYSGAYWDASNGTGSKTGGSYQKCGVMTQIEGTNIWYYDAEAANVSSSYTYVAFTEKKQDNYTYFSYQSGTTPNKVIYRGDYKSTQLPMFVPLAGQTGVKKNSNQAVYYNEGYWMNYPENTGYVLKIYESKTYGTSDEMQSIPFEFTADKTMPMSLTVELNANREYGFEIHRADGSSYGNNTKVMKINDSGDNGSPWAATSGKRTGLKTSVAGEYIFTLSFGNNGGYNYLVGVHYPVAANDYRIVYNDRVTWSHSTAHDASWHHPSRAIHKEDGAKDTVSFYVSKAAGASASMKFQYASSISGEGVVTWSEVASGSIDLSSIKNSGVYNFILTQSAGSISVEKIEPYTGAYYIRTDCAGSTKWDNYRAADHQMTYSEFSKSRETNKFGDLFSHYYTKWCPRGMNIKFCIANDYSSCVSDTLIQDDAFDGSISDFENVDAYGTLKNHGESDATADPYSANIRFMYDESNNRIKRAYVAASTNVTKRFLVLQGDAKLKDKNGNAIPATANLEANAVLFQDDQNWIYETTVKAIPGARIRIYANYLVGLSEQATQFFCGASGDWDEAHTVELLGGSGESPMLVRVIYDFKTNRLVCAWMPDGSEIEGDNAINADIMVVREHQDAAQTITFKNDESKLSEVKTVYGAMKFNRWILNNRQHPEDINPDHCRAANIESDLTTYHPVLPPAEQKSIYERSLYFISFPFRVKLSEVFGFGKYWDEWYIEYYDGETRAKNGYWKDSPPNWKYVTTDMLNSFYLEPNVGYILGLDLDYMQAENTTFWANGISNVELYFPSQESIETIGRTAVKMPALGDEYLCTINRGTSEGDRRVKDSYWRCIGVPGYSSYNNTLTVDGTNEFSWQTNTAWREDFKDYPFLYEWNMTDNTLTAQSTNRYNFKAMHAYLVQNGNEIHWSAISATPVSPIVARNRAASQTEYLWRLTMERDGEEEDQAFVRMTDEEDVTDGFDFGQDLVKEYNNARSDLYTYIGYERAAANSMPLHTEETTSIPVGVSIEKGGEYTFAMPDGTSGVGITLVDSETGARTNLSAGFTYTVNFEKGDYNNRLYLEISPVSQISTGVGAVSDQSSEIRKVVIDGLLYIVKDGQMYDATGKICK